MRNYKHNFIYGFAIFAMFFGSGNLVFPFQIGQASGNYWIAGFLGLFLTGIILPFFGLYVIKLYHGSYDLFFAEGGKLARVILPFFTLSLLGAFGVVPRCITVAYGGIGYIFPQLSLVIFSLIFCIICFVICLKDHLVINIIGKWMAPIKLVSLLTLIILGVINAPIIVDNNKNVTEVFTNGFLVGYQTMDLFAAFFFSSFIFKQIQDSMPKNTAVKEVIKAAIKPSLIGVIILGVIYLGLVFLGSYYKAITANVGPEFILPTIAMHIIGEKAALLIGIIMLFSCLTTAVALNNIYARYLCSLFSLQKNKFILMLITTTTMSFLVSLLDFRGIAAFLAPVLEVSYPSIIFLTITGITGIGNKKIKIIGFYGLLLVMLYQRFF
jgi:LIVCS family branched-chain amino acid:cation transporter